MGYYSDVRGLIYGDPDQMVTFIAKHKLKKNACFEQRMVDLYRLDVPAYDTKKPDGSVTTKPITVIDMKSEGSKWYPEFDVVQDWDALIEDAEEFKLNYEMYVVGEEVNDVEYKNSGNDLRFFLYLERRIFSDMPERIELE